MSHLQFADGLPKLKLPKPNKQLKLPNIGTMHLHSFQVGWHVIASGRRTDKQAEQPFAQKEKYEKQVQPRCSFVFEVANMVSFRPMHPCIVRCGRHDTDRRERGQTPIF
jgi:hypothetical protein